MSAHIPDEATIRRTKSARREVREAGGKAALDRRARFVAETGLDVDAAREEVEVVGAGAQEEPSTGHSKHKAQGGEDSDEERGAEPRSSVAKVKVVKRVVGEEEEVGAQHFDHGYTLEPFNLRRERNEGYFDEHGTYVWRKDEDGAGAGDAWLAGVGDEVFVPAPKTEEEQAREDEEAVPQDALELKERIARHMRPGERVVNALKRLGGSRAGRPAQGGTARRQRARAEAARGGDGKKRPRSERREAGDEEAGAGAAPAKRRRTGAASAAGGEEAQRRAFEEITDAADALLRSGEVDVYQTARERLVEEARSERRRREQAADAAGARGAAVPSAWVYRLLPPPAGAAGTTGGRAAPPEVHGPYSFGELLAWRKQGYFGAGADAELRCVSYVDEVDTAVRRVRAARDAATAGAVCAADELMDDFEEEEEGGSAPPGTAGAEVAATASVGKWQLASVLDFDTLAALDSAG